MPDDRAGPEAANNQGAAPPEQPRPGPGAGADRGGAPPPQAPQPGNGFNQRLDGVRRVNLNDSLNNPPNPSPLARPAWAEAPRNELGGQVQGERVDITQAGVVNDNSSTTTTTNTDNSSNITNNAGTQNYNFFGNIPSPVQLQAMLRGGTSNAFSGSYDGWRQAVPGSIAFARGNVSESTLDRSTLPANPQEIRDWYNGFNAAEKAFVQAMAILSGAPEHEIIEAAAALYRPFRVSDERRTVIFERPGIEDYGSYAGLQRLSLTLDDAFLARTHTVRRQVDRVKRLFWQDAASDGFSNFALQVLKIIGEDAAIAGPVGQHFLRQVEQLSRGYELKSEGNWRIPRTLGSLWLDEDDHQLEIIARNWLADRRVGEADQMLDERVSEIGPWRVAHLLYGAYETECGDLDGSGERASRSVVLRLLDSWTIDVHTSSSAFHKRLAYTIANTYSLIGQKTLSAALKGLEELLHYDMESDERTLLVPQDVFFHAVLAYVTLARYGALSEILQHFATTIEPLSHRREDRNMRDPGEYLSRKALTLHTLFSAFILLAVFSLSEKKEITKGLYSLTEHPGKEAVIPDEKGRDILLAGILTRVEPVWKRDVVTILCAMIIEGQDESAFYLMREWAETILQERGRQSLDLRAAYLEFVLDVLYQVDQWRADLKKKANILTQFRVQLKQWKKRDNPALLAFVNDLQQRLGI